MIWTCFSGATGQFVSPPKHSTKQQQNLVGCWTKKQQKHKKHLSFFLFYNHFSITAGWHGHLGHTTKLLTTASINFFIINQFGSLFAPHSLPLLVINPRLFLPSPHYLVVIIIIHGWHFSCCFFVFGLCSPSLSYSKHTFICGWTISFFLIGHYPQMWVWYVEWCNQDIHMLR